MTEDFHPAVTDKSKQLDLTGRNLLQAFEIVMSPPSPPPFAKQGCIQFL